MNNSKVIVRTHSAGVFYGTLKSFKGKGVVLTDARRLWYWAGAMTLSCLAVHGTAAPELCKFPVAVSSIVLTEVIEIIQTEEKAQASIEGVPIWHV